MNQLYYKLRKLLKGLMPFDYVVNRVANPDFLSDYIIPKDLPEFPIKSQSKFDYIVSVQGLGYSGSGAVVDLLREYKCCNVLGGVDKEGSCSDKSVGLEEINFLRLAGGLFDIEQNLSSKNIFINDALLNRFIKLANFTKILQQNIKVKELFVSFLNNLVEFKINSSETTYNPHLYSCYDNPPILFLRPLDLNSFRKLGNRFMTDLLDILYDENKTILVADQLFSDYEYNVIKNKQYIPNLKTIFVYRDPRDIYIYAKKNNIPWIPTQCVNDYIKWYKIITRYLDCNDPDILCIRFEDLIYKYDLVVKQIEEYLEFSNGLHDSKFMNFNPKKSAVNIGLWKQMPLFAADCDLIYSELTSLCYIG